MECLKTNNEEEEEMSDFVYHHLLDNLGEDKTNEFLSNLDRAGFRLIEIINAIDRKNRCGTRAPWEKSLDQLKH